MNQSTRAPCPDQQGNHSPLWLRALTDIPRVDGASWRQASVLTRWLIASRAALLIMTSGAVLFGALLAAWQGVAIEAARLLACLIGCTLAHATNNLLNDLIDHHRGLDAADSVRGRYGTHVLLQSLLTPRRLLHWALLTGTLASACGLYILLTGSWWVALPFGAGALLVVLYTFPLKPFGLGELAVLLVWGPLLVGGTYLALAGSLPAGVLGASLLYGIAPTLVILGKHLDKRVTDSARGLRTLPVLLGDARTRALMRGLLWCQYLLAPLMVVLSALPVGALLLLATLPGARQFDRLLRTSAPANRPAAFAAHAWPLWFASWSFLYTRWAMGTLLAGTLIWQLLFWSPLR